MHNLDHLTMFEGAGELIINATGESHAGITETPKRFARAMAELTRGYNEDPRQHVKIFDNVRSSSMIMMMGVSFTSLCEHHMLPFSGHYYVGYIAKDNKVLGASKLARIFDCFACRLQVQERIGEQYLDFLMEYLQPEGCGVRIVAQHQCMMARGIKKEGFMGTTAIRGSFLEPDVKAEFLGYIKE